MQPRLLARHVGNLLAIVGLAMLIPALLLSLAAVGWVEEYTAYFLALGSGIVLLEVTPQVLATALPIGAAGAVLVEVVERVAAADRRAGRA